MAHRSMAQQFRCHSLLGCHGRERAQVRRRGRAVADGHDGPRVHRLHLEQLVEQVHLESVGAAVRNYDDQLLGDEFDFRKQLTVLNNEN